MADRPEDLIGGYATDNLTLEERKTLLSAAADDQALFDALMQEDALKEALEDRRVRAEVLQALSEPAEEKRWWAAFLSMPAMAAAAVLVAVVGVALLVRNEQSQPTEPATSVAKGPAPAGRQLAAWVSGAPITTPTSSEPNGAVNKEAGVRSEPAFLAPRTGLAEVFGITTDNTVRKLTSWTNATQDQPFALPSVTNSEYSQLRIVIVDTGVPVDNDEAVISAVEQGRGAVYRQFLLPR